MEQVNLIGVKADGSSTLLGTVPMPPAMKQRELAREMFGQLSEDDSGTDADCCLWALQNYHDWLVKSGWQAPPVEFTPVA